MNRQLIQLDCAVIFYNIHKIKKNLCTYLEFLSNTGAKVSINFSADTFSPGTESSNCGSTLSYDLLVVGLFNISYAIKT